MFFLKFLQAPVRDCGEDGQKKGGAGYMQGGGGRDSVPTRAGLNPQGLQRGKKGPVTPAVHSSQHRLKAQSHEVSRWNQESRRAKAGTLGQSCFSGVKATARFPPTRAPQPGSIGPFELPHWRSQGHLF